MSGADDSGPKLEKQHFVSPKARVRPPALTSQGSGSVALGSVPEEAAGKARGKGTPHPSLSHHATDDIITTAAGADDIRKRLEYSNCYPTAKSLVLFQIAMSMGYTAYMLTSWLYCAIQRLTLFPACSAVWGVAGSWAAWGCIIASWLFWTFPLFCCIVFLLYMYRDTLHTRIYYEMFSHRVHLDFMNIGFFQAPMVILMLVWMALCVLMYPMTWAVTFPKIAVTLPFWIPVLSFGAMLFSQWDLETRLLSVSKFVESDVEWANTHMLESYFLRDYVAEAATHRVVKKLEAESSKPQLTMGEYIHMICNEAESMHNDGEEPDEALASKTLVSSWSSTYWVKLLVYSEYVVDAEYKKFHWWFAGYKVFTLVMVTFFLSLAFVTTVTHMHQQGVLPSSILTEWVHLDYVTILPYNPGSVPGTSQANAVAATVTTGGYHYIRDLDRLGEGKVNVPPPSDPPRMPISKSRSDHGSHAAEKMADNSKKQDDLSNHAAEKKADKSKEQGDSSKPALEKRAVTSEKRAGGAAYEPAQEDIENLDDLDQLTKTDNTLPPSHESSIVPFGSHEKHVPPKNSKNRKDGVVKDKLIDRLLGRFDTSEKARRKASQIQIAQSMRTTAS